MTDAEKLEWACGVFNRERWLGREWSVHTIPPPKAQQFQAIAIALALDEQARRRLPEREQAEWAAGELDRRGHRGTGWYFSLRSGEMAVENDELETLEWPDALAIAESYTRREMLGEVTT